MKGRDGSKSSGSSDRNQNLLVSSWLPPPEKAQLARDEVHLWLANQDDHGPHFSPLSKSLSGGERERAKQFHFDKHRNRFILRRILLRSVLGSYLGIEPGKLEIHCDSFGKPYTRSHPPLSFNLSHSGEIVLLAVAGGNAVGVDIERIAETLKGEEIARRFFSSQEVSCLLALPPAAQKKAFFDCWTRKEAYTKARGQGLSLPLDSFSVSLDPGEPAVLLASEEGQGELDRWFLADLRVDPQYAAALAAEGTIRKLRYWRWSDDWPCQFK